MDALALVSLFVLVLVLGVLGGGLIYVSRKNGNESSEEPDELEQPTGRGRRGGGRLRARRRQRQAQHSDDDDDSEEGSDEEDEDEVVVGGNRRDRVAARRRARQREREEERDAERAQREAKENKISAYEERRRQRELEREEQEQREEEERRKRLEERQKQEEEEASKWAEFISVEQTGANEDESGEGGLLQKFVDTIKERKMVVLEEVAVEFQLRTQEVIARIQELEAQGKLTGVMDDRGKFIYVSREEMEKVSNFIRSKGRVSIAQLAKQSNTFVDLEAKSRPADVPELDLGEFEEGPAAVVEAPA